MSKLGSLLLRGTGTEISAEVADAIRRAVIEIGQEQEKVIIIGQLNIQLNMAQGGGAKVEVLNK